MTTRAEAAAARCVDFIRLVAARGEVTPAEAKAFLGYGPTDVNAWYEMTHCLSDVCPSLGIAVDYDERAGMWVHVATPADVGRTVGRYFGRQLADVNSAIRRLTPALEGNPLAHRQLHGLATQLQGIVLELTEVRESEKSART